jgi:hypothetical protein
MISFSSLKSFAVPRDKIASVRHGESDNKTPNEGYCLTSKEIKGSGMQAFVTIPYHRSHVKVKLSLCLTK